MLTQDSIEELNQNYDDMSCVTGVTGTTGISFFAWDRIIDLPEEFVHAVEVSETGYNRKRAVAALINIQNKMESIKN